MAEFSNDIPLRVLMTTDTVGGVWCYSIQLIRALRSYNVQFLLITAGAPVSEQQRKEADELDNVRLVETSFALEWMENPWEDIEATGQLLLSLEKEFEPDLIHLNSYSYASLSFDCPVIVVAHSDVTSWWNAIKQEPLPTTWDYYYQHVREGLRRADHVIAPSATILKSIFENYGLKNTSSVIYNAVDADQFAPAEKAHTIMSAGRIWDEAKNIQLLVRAAKEIQWPVVIAGDTNFETASAHLDAPSLECIGKISSDEIATRLSTTSIYVLPAKYEPFGLSILEAGMCGCALVLGDIPSLREIWNDAAVYVNPEDPNALAAEINLLIKDESWLKEMASRAAKRAHQYSVKRMASEYFATYQSLIKAKQFLHEQETV